MPSWLISPLVSLVLFAIVAGGAWSAKHSYDERRRAEGRSQLQPALNASVDQLKADVAAFKAIEESMLALTKKSAAVSKAVTVATKTNIVRERVAETRVEFIDRIVPVGDTACEQTKDAIQKVLR